MRQRLLVLTVPKVTLAVTRLATGLVLEDVTKGTQLGQLVGDLGMFEVEVDGGPHLVLAAEADEAFDHVTVEPEGLMAKVVNGVWMTPPTPLVRDRRLTVVWRNATGRELRRYETPPLRRTMLQSRRGGEWLPYAHAH